MWSQRGPRFLRLPLGSPCPFGEEERGHSELGRQERGQNLPPHLKLFRISRSGGMEEACPAVFLSSPQSLQDINR
jgi:hypothetical protein